MSGIDIFAWLVLIVIVVSVAVVFVALAMLPGKIARKRGHPQAEAINAAGWLGLLLTLGVVWALAVIWALTKPVAPTLQGADVAAFETRIAALEARLQAGDAKSAEEAEETQS